MIVLYEIVPGPVGDCAEGGRTCLSPDAWSGIPRWWGERIKALRAMEELAQRVGRRHQPWHQNTEPLALIVVRYRFRTIVDVANNHWLSRSEAGRIFQLADGSLCQGAQ